MKTGIISCVLLLFKFRLLSATVCGIRPQHAARAGNKRITGGRECVPGGWPWMAALYVRESSKYFKCGAALISDRYVLSAGHCGITQGLLGMSKFQPSQVTVRLGKHNLSVDKKTEQEIPAKRLIFNPSWAFVTKNTTTGTKMITTNDMMLIELKYPAKLSKYIQPICLRNEPFKPGKMCHVAGWGNAKVHGPLLGTLHEADVPIVNKDYCNKPKSYNGMITDELLCAGFAKGGKDTCEGDSGGPLMCQGEDKKWYVAGVASFGHNECGVAHKYGVYASTSAMKSRKWIESKTRIHFL